MENEVKRIPGMLSDVDIRKCFGDEIKIYTEHKVGEFKFDLDKQLQLASIDLRFRNECKRFKDGMSCNLTYEMLKNHEYTAPFEISNNEKLVINPGEVIFTTTLETVSISTNYAGIITGRSSIARLGIMVHCCQEFINPGQGAPIALQITNLGKYSVELDLKIPICQLILFRLSTPSSDAYNNLEKSKYKNEREPITSRIYEDSNIKSVSVSPVKDKIIPAKWISFCKRYFSPFLPSMLMFLFITPALESSQNITISNILSMPILWIVGAILVIIYVICRKAD